MPIEPVPTNASLTLVRTIMDRLSDTQCTALHSWAARLLEIRSSTAPRALKARHAIAATLEAQVVWPVIRSIASQLKDFVWNDRGWPARLALAAGGAAVAAVGGQGAGIAALGGAIGLPLWMVFGAGGAFAGMLVEELGKARVAPAEGPSAGAEPEEADWEFLNEGRPLPFPHGGRIGDG